MEQAAKSDAELIREALSDADAFGVLYGRHVHSIHLYLRGRAPEDAAMELTAETFAQAALGLRRFRDLADGSARPWLHGGGAFTRPELACTPFDLRPPNAEQFDGAPKGIS